MEIVRVHAYKSVKCENAIRKQKMAIINERFTQYHKTRQQKNKTKERRKKTITNRLRALSIT